MNGGKTKMRTVADPRSLEDPRGEPPRNELDHDESKGKANIGVRTSDAGHYPTFRAYLEERSRRSEQLSAGERANIGKSTVRISDAGHNPTLRAYLEKRSRRSEQLSAAERQGAMPRPLSGDTLNARLRKVEEDFFYEMESHKSKLHDFENRPEINEPGNQSESLEAQSTAAEGSGQKANVVEERETPRRYLLEDSSSSRIVAASQSRAKRRGSHSPDGSSDDQSSLQQAEVTNLNVELDAKKAFRTRVPSTAKAGVSDRQPQVSSRMSNLTEQAQSSGRLTESLKNEFCPPVNEAVFRSIVSQNHPANVDGLRSARGQLKLQPEVLRVQRAQQKQRDTDRQHSVSQSVDKDLPVAQALHGLSSESVSKIHSPARSRQSSASFSQRRSQASVVATEEKAQPVIMKRESTEFDNSSRKRRADSNEHQALLDRIPSPTKFWKTRDNIHEMEFDIMFDPDTKSLRHSRDTNDTQDERATDRKERVELAFINVSDDETTNMIPHIAKISGKTIDDDAKPERVPKIESSKNHLDKIFTLQAEDHATTDDQPRSFHGTLEDQRSRRLSRDLQRTYSCGSPGCEKAYATLDNLNAHLVRRSHGPLRSRFEPVGSAENRTEDSEPINNPERVAIAEDTVRKIVVPELAKSKKNRQASGNVHGEDNERLLWNLVPSVEDVVGRLPGRGVPISRSKSLPHFNQTDRISKSQLRRCSWDVGDAVSGLTSIDQTLVISTHESEDQSLVESAEPLLFPSTEPKRWTVEERAGAWKTLTGQRSSHLSPEVASLLSRPFGWPEKANYTDLHPPVESISSNTKPLTQPFWDDDALRTKLFEEVPVGVQAKLRTDADTAVDSPALWGFDRSILTRLPHSKLFSGSSQLSDAATLVNSESNGPSVNFGEFARPVMFLRGNCYDCVNDHTQCDMQWPTCAECTRRGTKCMTFDPLNRIKIPRSSNTHLLDREGLSKGKADPSSDTGHSEEESLFSAVIARGRASKSEQNNSDTRTAPVKVPSTLQLENAKTKTSSGIGLMQPKSRVATNASVIGSPRSSTASLKTLDDTVQPTQTLEVREEVKTPVRWLNIPSVSRVAASFQNLLMTLNERPPEPGMRRVEWVCACGLRVADDYTERKSGSLDALQQILNGLKTSSCSNGANKASLGGGQNGVGGSSQEVPLSGLKNGNSQDHTNSAKPSSSVDLERGSDDIHIDVASTGSTMSLPRPMHLVMGYPDAKLATKVKQPDTCDITSDRQFFCRLRGEYTSFCGGLLRRLFSLRVLAEVRFVQFELWHAGFAQIRKMDDIPPEDRCLGKSSPELAADVYTYNPVPASDTPPLGSNTITHIMQCADSLPNLDQTKLFELFPRKLFKELEACPHKGFSIGWGLQFVEGVSRARVFGLGLFCSMLSTILGIAWAIATRSIQNGFAIAAYMMMVLVFALGSLQAVMDKP